MTADEVNEEPLILDTPEDAAPEVGPVEVDPVEADADDDGEVIIEFDGEEPIVSAAKPADSSVMRDMRRRMREQAAEIARLNSQQELAPAPVVEDAGPVPTLESCDWDEQRLSDAIEARAERRAAIERNRLAREDMAAKQAAADAEEAAQYVKARSALGARDYADAEADFVAAIPNPTLQRLIVRASDNPAAVIYALYKSPARMAEIAAITDAAKMAAAVGKLEAKLKVTKTASKVQAERRVTGSGQLSGTASSSYEANLERLREKANATGDFTPVLDYKRKWKDKIAASA